MASGAARAAGGFTDCPGVRTDGGQTVAVRRRAAYRKDSVRLEKKA
jgi:hypothetical protein